jgi:hypothetical protein
MWWYVHHECQDSNIQEASLCGVHTQSKLWGLHYQGRFGGNMTPEKTDDEIERVANLGTTFIRKLIKGKTLFYIHVIMGEKGTVVHTNINPKDMPEVLGHIASGYVKNKISPIKKDK